MQAVCCLFRVGLTLLGNSLVITVCRLNLQLQNLSNIEDRIINRMKQSTS